MTNFAGEPKTEGSPPPAPRGGPWRLVLLGVAAAGMTAASILLPVKAYLQALLEATAELGAWGPLVVGGVYVPAAVFLVPGSVITLGAGFLFGVVKGTVVVSLGSTTGACAAFLVGQRVARDWIARKVASNPKFATIDRAVGEQGFKIVLLARLSPIFPFNMLNYLCSLTRVPFWKYALASWVGMLPGTVMYVYLGSAARSLAEAATDREGGTTAETVFFWAGLAVAVGVALFVARLARRALHMAVEQPEADAEDEGCEDTP